MSFALKIVLSAHDTSVLSEGFSEGTLTNLRTGFPESKDAFRDDYEYHSDSDLEEAPEVPDIEGDKSDTLEEVTSEEMVESPLVSESESTQRDPFDMDVFTYPNEDISDLFLQPLPTQRLFIIFYLAVMVLNEILILQTMHSEYPRNSTSSRNKA